MSKGGQYGLAEELISQGTKVPKWQYRKHETSESIVLDLSLIADSTNHPYRLQCEQFLLYMESLIRPEFSILH